MSHFSVGSMVLLSYFTLIFLHCSEHQPRHDFVASSLFYGLSKYPANVSIETAHRPGTKEGDSAVDMEPSIVAASNCWEV